MSCSTNKLKSDTLFTCKNAMFSDFTWEKKFCSKKPWEGVREIRETGLFTDSTIITVMLKFACCTDY